MKIDPLCSNDLLGSHLVHQHLLCAADGILEPPWVIYDNLCQIIHAGIDGEGYQYQFNDATHCRKQLQSLRMPR